MMAVFFLFASASRALETARMCGVGGIKFRPSVLVASRCSSVLKWPLPRAPQGARAMPSLKQILGSSCSLGILELTLLSSE